MLFLNSRFRARVKENIENIKDTRPPNWRYISPSIYLSYMSPLILAIVLELLLPRRVGLIVSATIICRYYMSSNSEN